jgi:hypothetical protein
LKRIRNCHDKAVIPLGKPGDNDAHIPRSYLPPACANSGQSQTHSRYSPADHSYGTRDCPRDRRRFGRQLRVL